MKVGVEGASNGGGGGQNDGMAPVSRDRTLTQEMKLLTKDLETLI